MDNSDFLEEMENDKYVNEKEIEDNQDKLDKIQDKIDKKQNKINSKISNAQRLEEKQQKLQEKLREKENKINSNNESSEIIGKNKRQLLTKINKYKKLYKTELSDYKIMKNASEIQLEEHIKNIEDILDTTEIDTFINDSIFHSISVLENFTINTKYNIKGLSAMLKLNNQFMNLTNRLMLKYDLFKSTPIEYQMLMCITASIYLTIQKNNARPVMEQYLNQKI